LKRVAIFASGGGSNARCIIEHLSPSQDKEVALIVTNRSQAGVLHIAKENSIPSVVINKNKLNDREYMEALLSKHKIDFIALAGFLMLIPEFLVEAFENRMVNIHPSLLPKYGGKGMFGHHVHQAVKEAGELESGMTIHYVTKEYDKGGVILQARTQLLPEDSAEKIAAKVLKLEHYYYPIVVEELLSYDLD
jgi:phosphoribosylglycinamide formyltransferase-1